MKKWGIAGSVRIKRKWLIGIGFARGRRVPPVGMDEGSAIRNHITSEDIDLTLGMVSKYWDKQSVRHLA